MNYKALYEHERKRSEKMKELINILSKNYSSYSREEADLLRKIRNELSAIEAESGEEEEDDVDNTDDTLLAFMDDIQHMQKLYSNDRFTQAYQWKLKLIEQLDDIMRIKPKQ